MDYSFTQINSVTFKLLSKSEAKKLSVLPISSVQTFDLLGHPLDNGLCDTLLGPIKRNDFCKTCGLTECLGHFGHIQLPLPVFNPFLIKETYQVLKMFCFDCHHLLFTPFNLEIYIAQIRAIDMGLDYILDDIFSYGSAISQASKGYDWSSYEGITYLRSKLNEMINCEFKKTNVKLHKAIDNENVKVLNLESVEIVNSKNIIEKKQRLFKELFNCKIIKPNRHCVHCKARKRGLSIVNKCLIMTSDTKSIANSEQTEEIGKIDLKSKTYLTPSQARYHFRKLWINEKDILIRLFPFINIDFDDGNFATDEDDCPMDVFFWDTIVVSPNRFRPLRHLNNRSFEHYQTHALSEIMLVAKSLEQSLENAKSKNTGENIARFHFQWQKLQLLCNRIYDSAMDNLPDNKTIGVKQVLEKKEGLMRKNMMGKRVNFAARSVISPDPYIMVDEIGVPEIFATKLSYPQPVTNWNVKQLQEMIINGPNKYPGALSIIDEDGFTVRLKSDDITQRKSIAASLHSSSLNQNISGVKIVNRHLISGDIMLLNRQPTLHKPSIMAHKARVLPKEKTLRLHYANCKCYNADFDGDEMNAHFPQSELARSEAYNLASVNYQFLVPKDGSPLSGLIQDHIVAGVFISIRGRFFNKNDYQQLVYGAISFLNQRIKLVPPSIIKPNCLWSGKQIISTLLLNIIPDGKPLPSFEIESKISSKVLTVNKPRPWTAGGPLNPKDMCESQVLFRHGELLCGIMDKSNFGATKNGLIHICYELYGDNIHLKLLTAIARLCTNFLQSHLGFTLGIDDILLRPKSDSKRKKLIQQSPSIILQAVSAAFNVNEDLLEEKLQIAHTSKKDNLMKQLDSTYKSQTALLNDQITNICMPKGLVKKFPNNNLQMMIQTGAKGGSVNAIQISCLLGQIELGGRRIPLMMSGRTLPSFRSYETDPRAGGFVTDCFLSGLRPQEFFFHCMAGREGLIDTVVKTSRSGYLQRCLIKHLEGLVVNYDLTVRDSEGSVIQWLYGEDGLDISRSQSLKKSFFPVIKNNIETLKPQKEEQAKFTQNLPMEKEMEKVKKYLSRIVDQNLKIRNANSSPFLLFEQKQKLNNVHLNKDDLKNMWYNLDNKQKQSYLNATFRKFEPIIPRYRPDLNVGAISESLSKSINDYVRTNLANCSKEFISEFCQTLNHCYMRSLCHPGEAVGLLAAQSIGEPSTQMTLNTFHFAGRSEMNVTLGVPRLRELLMTASSNISTPCMDIPFRTDLDESVNLEKKAESIRLKLNAVRLKDVLEYVDIIDKIEIKQLQNSSIDRFRVYNIRFQFLPKSYYKRRCYTNPQKILYFMENIFIRKFIEALNRRIRLLAKSDGLFDSKTIRIVNRSGKTKKSDVDEEEMLHQDGDKNVDDDNKAALHYDDDDDDDDFDDYDVDIGEGDTTAMRQRSRLNQEQEYEEPDDDEVEMTNEDDIEDGYSSNDDEGKKNSQSKIKQEITDDDQLGILYKDIKQEIIDENYKELKQKLGEDERLKNKVETRRRKVLNKIPDFLLDYNFDVQEELWCEIKLKFPLAVKLDIRSILEEEADQTFVYRVGRIDRAFLEKDFEAAERGAKFTKLIKTEGVSIAQMVHFENYLDIRKIYTNDMHQIARTYGIEAARAALIREIKNVFAVYGISVDGRHLSLIADHMTFTGHIKGMNRGAMNGISPLQAMTFETTTNFMKNSLLLDLKDDLKSPSSRLVIGRPTVVGTGLFDVLLKPKQESHMPSELMTRSIRQHFSKQPGSPFVSPNSTKSFLTTSILSNLFDSTKRLSKRKLEEASQSELSKVKVKEEIDETETIITKKKKLKSLENDQKIKLEFD